MADHPINLKDDSLLQDASILPQMRFLFNDEPIFELALSLVLSVVHLGNQGANEKDKIRSNLKILLEAFLNASPSLYPRMKKNASHIGNLAMEDH